MNEKRYAKLHKEVTDNAAKRFKDLSFYIVDNHCTNMDGSKILGTDRSNLAYSLSMDMCLGSKFDKNMYIGMGVIIGISACSILYVTHKQFINKKRRNQNEQI